MIDSSKICAINNEAKYGTGVIGYVLYHGNEKEFSIELDEALSLSDVPIFFETFIKNRTFTITDHFARKWVDQRIVPKNRQNLGMILKEAGLNEYDPYALLLWGGGRSSQDDCRITRCDEKNAVFPLWFTKRLDEKPGQARHLGRRSPLGRRFRGTHHRPDAVHGRLILLREPVR